MSLRDRVVLITGASRGIGAATALELDRRGAAVAITGIEPDELRRLGQRLRSTDAWFEADVRDRASIGNAVEAVVARFGRIDAVVANAGVVNYGTIRTADPDAFATTIDVNLNGVYRTLAATVPHLTASQGYALVIGSVASLVPLPGANAYAASKAALDQLVRGLRIELHRTGVDIGIAYPSWVDTDLVRETERALPSFAAMRNSLPWPVRSTSTADSCARALARGIERRSSRIYFPRRIALVNVARPIVNSSIGEAVMRRRTATLMPSIDADVEALEATTAIEQGV